MLDYDKKFLLKSYDNLTFDGSSIRGFTAQNESDLRLGIDWGVFLLRARRHLRPRQGPRLRRRHRQGRRALRRRHPRRAQDLRQRSCYEKKGYTLNAANEIEGFLFAGVDAERNFHQTGKFDYVNTGGYYHSLPGDPLRTFIDTAAEVQRAMGFENEKDHPEVAPSQFEINYGYGEVVAAADQIQLYKLICRQVATSMGMTASLPAQARGRRQRQRHAHQRLHQQGRQEPLLGSKGRGEALQVWLGVSSTASSRTATISACS